MRLLGGLDRDPDRVRPGEQPGHDVGQRLGGDDVVARRQVEQLVLGGRRLELDLTRLEADPLLDALGCRAIRAREEQHPVGERAVGGDLGQVDGAQRLGGRLVVLEAGRVAQPVLVHAAVVLAQGEQRLALAQERPPAQARVPEHERAERRRRGRVAAGDRGAEAHADRGDVGDTEVEQVLAGRLDAGQPRRDPVRVVLEPGRVTRAVVVEAQRDEALRSQLLGEPAEVRCAERPSSPIGGQSTTPPRAKPSAGVETQPYSGRSDGPNHTWALFTSLMTGSS